MTDNRIEEGDAVRVDFNNAQYTLCSLAYVQRVPVATGDSWIFEDAGTGQVHYVSEGCTVTLINKLSGTEADKC